MFPVTGCVAEAPDATFPPRRAGISRIERGAICRWAALAWTFGLSHRRSLPRLVGDRDFNRAGDQAADIISVALSLRPFTTASTSRRAMHCDHRSRRQHSGTGMSPCGSTSGRHFNAPARSRNNDGNRCRPESGEHTAPVLVREEL